MWAKILAGVFGIVVGFIVVLWFRVRSVRKRINASLRKIGLFELTSSQKREIERIITEKRKLYKKQNKGVVCRDVLGLKKKKSNVFPKAYWHIIKEVALVFDDKRQNPFLDFSIKSAFDFLNKVTDRIESILDDMQIPVLKNLKLSTIMGVTSIGKVFSNKVVKTGASFAKRLGNLFNLLNPYHWVKKIALSYFFTKIINEILLASVDVVAWEFARFYKQAEQKVELVAV